MSTESGIEKDAQGRSPVVEPDHVTTVFDTNMMEQPRPPGWRGYSEYMEVVGLFFVYFITWGQLSSFSAYQDYYEERMLATYSPSAISWIGTSQNFLVGTVGLLSGVMYDRGYTREALIPGFIFVVVSFLLLSFSQQFWHVLLSQGFLFGIGNSFVYRNLGR